MTLRMIDESSWQARTWTAARLKAAGVQAVAVKATEGTGYGSPDYHWQCGQARSAGAALIHYHLARYGDTEAEASWFTTHVGLLPGDLLMLDNEAKYITALPPAAAAAWVSAWTKEVMRLTGAPAVIQYTSRDPVSRGCFLGVKNRGPLFLADPGANPKAPPIVPGWPVSFLQYTTRTDQGTQTDVDAAYYGSEAQLRKLGIPQAAPATDEPTRVVATGTLSMIQLAEDWDFKPSDIILATAFERLTGHMLAKPPVWGALEAGYLDAGDWSRPLPAGSVWWVP